MITIARMKTLNKLRFKTGPLKFPIINITKPIKHMFSVKLNILLREKK